MEAELAGINNKEETRWARGLDSRVIRRIAEMEPDEVLFHVKMPRFVVCAITKGQELGRGVAICSVRDKQIFDVSRGKNIAAGRALHALKLKRHDRPIRRVFSRTWLPSQVKLLDEMRQKFGYKCFYTDRIGL